MPRVFTRLGLVRTRFGRRTLLTFLGAALLPAALATGVGLHRLRESLRTESTESLGLEAKAAAVAVLDRLDILITRASDAPAATTRRLERSPAGGTGFVITTGADSFSQQRAPLDLAPLWAALRERFDAHDEGVCVHTGRPPERLYCSPGVPSAVVAALDRDDATDEDGAVRSVAGYLVATRDVFLRHAYDTDTWSVALVRSNAPMMATLRRERQAALLIGLLALVTAFVLSHVQLRRDTAPIEALQRASRSLSLGELDARVHVERDDEFGELGQAFNGMARSLQQQLAMLSALEVLDETALRAPTPEALAASALSELGRHAPVSIASVLLIDGDDDDRARYLTITDDARETIRESEGRLSPPCRSLLRGTATHLTEAEALRRSSLVDPAIAAWQNAGIREVLLVPLRQEHVLLGAVVLALTSPSAEVNDAVQIERRLAERLALGLAKARLLERMERLSTGTLRAFGSAIDANSRWTAGHSERVSAIAVLLAETLGLDAQQRDTLRRGCLLHDIGKVGIPASILDKPAALTEAEFAIIRRHPEIGAEILGTIPVFRDLLPIVRWHHERMDGTGYPDRLRGEEIPLLARIAAVADVFDALTSERPYRHGLPLETTIANIRSSAGTHFDPRVTEALRALSHDSRLAAIVAAPSLDRAADSSLTLFEPIPHEVVPTPATTSSSDSPALTREQLA